MSRPVLVLRPQPGNAVTCEGVRALGLEPVPFPLFEARALPWQCPNPSKFDGLLLTSANAVRLAGPQLGRLLHLPVYAVGPATGKAARQAGFSRIEIGPSDLDALIQQIETTVNSASLLHLCGTETVDMVAKMLSISHYHVYEMADTEHSALAGLEAKAPLIAMLHSPKAAARFSSIIGAKPNARSAITLVAISAATSQASGNGWQRVAIATEPRDEAMLRLLPGLAGY